MAKLGDTITKDSAPELFGLLDVEYKPKKVKGKPGGTVTIGDKSESWTWTDAGTIPPRASKVRSLLATLKKYRKAYRVKEPRADTGTATGAGAGAVVVTATPGPRAKKTEAAYWHGYTVEVLDQITKAIAEAKATATERKRAETARRTVEGLEELGLPVSDELRTLAEAPKAEADTKPQE